MINNDLGIVAGIVIFKNSDEGVFYRSYPQLAMENTKYQPIAFERQWFEYLSCIDLDSYT